jgi:deoxyribonucleoside regulator
MAYKQRDELASRTALLYYEYQKSQNEIAAELGISRSYVSQLLSYAREAGMVKITINIDNDYLQEAVFAAKFPHLRHVYILQSPSTEYTEANIGQFAAPHISRLVNGADRIGINLGYAVQSVIECLDESDFQPLKHKTVVQIMGGVGNGLNDTMMPGELVTRLAKTIGAKCFYLNCPVIIENSSLKQALMQESSIALLVNAWKTLDLVIMGIGVVDERSRLFPMLSSEMRTIIEKSHACSEITVNFFTEHGEYLPILLDNKLSIPYKDLRTVKTKVVIGHGLHKARAILAGLRAKMIDVLVTDSITLEEMNTIESSASILNMKAKNPMIQGEI